MAPEAPTKMAPFQTTVTPNPWGSERNAMVAFAVRKFSLEPENRLAGSEDRKILRNTGSKRRKPGDVVPGFVRRQLDFRRSPIWGQTLFTVYDCVLVG